MLQVARLNTIGLRPFSSLSDLGSINRADVIGATDTVWMGKLVKAVAESGDNEHAAAIDEYFRKNFRKLSVRQALDVLEPLGEEEVEAPSLDGKFWIWESLDEAIRGDIESLTDEEFDKAFAAFAVNMKGSNELLDMFESRIYRRESDGLFKS